MILESLTVVVMMLLSVYILIYLHYSSFKVPRASGCLAHICNNYFDIFILAQFGCKSQSSIKTVTSLVELYKQH